MDLKTTLRKLTYVPVIEIDDAANALPLAEALISGGIGCIEVTLRTDAAQASIKVIAKSGLPLMVGVGTVTRAEQVSMCVDIGAQFAVSPGFTESLGMACRNSLAAAASGHRNAKRSIDCAGCGLRCAQVFPGIAVRRRGVAESHSGADSAGDVLPDRWHSR